MGNIMDYIEWRGDLPFTQSEFNDVDNLILACFFFFFTLNQILQANQNFVNYQLAKVLLSL